ncbi:MAG: DNA polymerase I, partial [Planctomycetia bacterium]
QVIDFQALVGDSVDNVPGVPLIGPKIARELLEKWGTLEEVLDHAEEVSGKKRKQNLMEGREMAMLSRQLVRLNTETPVALDWDAARVEHVNFYAARPLFVEHGFRSLVKKLDEMAPLLAAGLAPALENAGGTASVDMASAGTSPAANNTIDISKIAKLVDTPEKFEEFFKELQKQKSFSFDTETTHLWPRWAKLVGMSFCWNDNEAYYLPVEAPEGQDRLDKATVLDALRSTLEDPAVEKIGQNLKYDSLVLRGEGVRLRGIGFDTMVADYLCQAGNRRHNLDELASRYLNHETIKITDLGAKKSEIRMETVDTTKICEYAAEDALIPWLLRPILEKSLEREKQESLFRDVELPLIETLADLEWNGIAVDRDRLKLLSDRYQKRIEELEDEIYQLAGHPFNIASPKQLQVVLFEELGLPVVKKTKTGASTDVDVLVELSSMHALPKKIVEYRHYAKLKSTYVDALPEMIHPTTGRIHTSFNQVVTATGRLSSSDPNLQNIPVRDAEGREIRSAFVPSKEGNVLLAADYSQIELRVLAHYSEDEHLCGAFERGEDIHARVASQVNEVPLDQVTSEMRRGAKTVNFGIIYGQSAFGLSKELGISREDASAFISSYFAQFTKVDNFFHRILDACRERGYVETILGRRRYIAGVRENPPRQTNLAERMAVNTVIQGSAADLIKLAMNSVRQELENRQFPAELLLQIHDELVFEVSSEQQDELAQLVVDKMSQAYPLRVPLVVSVKAGQSWGDLESL